MNLTCASFFAGVGGIDLAFESEGFKVVYANEMDKWAVKTYQANSNLKVDARDINEVKNTEIPPFHVLLAGFPCQPFSVAGKLGGFSDAKGRGQMFFRLLDIIQEHKPEIIFLENVKNLVSHDNGHSFRVIQTTLEKQGYLVKYKVMNTANYGNLPQNRERVYIVAFLNHETGTTFEFPGQTPLTTQLPDCIDFHSYINDPGLYYTSTSFGHFAEIEPVIKEKGVMYQWRRKYVRSNKSSLCPTLTANMGTGGHNVPLIYTSFGIRKLTPRECFRLQGFSDSFALPDMAPSHLYKQAGNSVSVTVIQRIAESIRKAVSNTNL